MGFFDIFLSEEKKIAANRRRLTSRDSQPEDREAAARWLLKNGTPKAILAALSRLDMKLEHQLNDKGEKDLIYALFVEVGEPVVKPLRSYLKQCRSVSVPLRLLEDLVGEEETIQHVFVLLQNELDRDDFKPEKKHALLTWLSDKKHAGALAAATPFVDDFDENVRCTAVEVLAFQNSDDARLPLEKRFLNKDEDSGRLRHRIAELFAIRPWDVSDPDGFSKGLPDGYSMVGSRVRSV